MSTATDGFGDPGLEFITDPAREDTAEPEKGPARAGGIGSGFTGWVTTQPWWTEPIAPLPVLLDHARDGEWTTSDRQRTTRVWWLCTVHRATRVLPWLVLRSRDPRPSLTGELPPVAMVRATTGATRGERGIKGGYVLASGLTQLGMYPTRATVTTSAAWLWANWANNVPVLRALIPDVVTAAYWWPGFLVLLRVALPVIAAAAVIGAAVAAVVWRSRRSSKRNRAGRRDTAEHIDDEGGA